MYSLYSNFNDATIVLIVLSIMLFAGFLMTRLTKLLKLPNVSGYIIAGMLIGPNLIQAAPPEMLKKMSFISDIALAFIAFGVGKFFKRKVLRATGSKVIIITLFESLIPGVMIALSMRYIFGFEWTFSALLGAIATATAPASTMMTIRQYRARGEFVNTLLQVVALDDVVCLVLFGTVLDMINADGQFMLKDVLKPVLANLAVVALGIACGFALSKMLTPTRSRDNRLIIALGMLLGISGLCNVFHISPLLACMVFGASYLNMTKDKALFKQLNHFTPPVMTVFFVLSGMNLDIGSLSTVGLVGVAYFVIRIVGKYIGAYLGCLVAGSSVPVRNYLGLALVPQAGVAIGLAFLGERLLPPEVGRLMLTIILASSVLYEIAGPASAKAALFLSGAIRPPKGDKKDELPPPVEAEMAITAREEAAAPLLEDSTLSDP